MLEFERIAKSQIEIVGRITQETITKLVNMQLDFIRDSLPAPDNCDLTTADSKSASSSTAEPVSKPIKKSVLFDDRHKRAENEGGNSKAAFDFKAVATTRNSSSQSSSSKIELPEKEALPLLDTDTFLSAVNSEMLCAVGGTVEKVNRLEERLKEKERIFKHLPVSRAFHTPTLLPIKQSFKAKCFSVGNRTRAKLVKLRNAAIGDRRRLCHHRFIYQGEV